MSTTKEKTVKSRKETESRREPVRTFGYEDRTEGRRVDFLQYASGQTTFVILAVDAGGAITREIAEIDDKWTCRFAMMLVKIAGYCQECMKAFVLKHVGKRELQRIYDFCIRELHELITDQVTIAEAA